MKKRWLLALSFPILFLFCAIPSISRADVSAMIENPQNGQAAAGIGVLSGWAFSDVDADDDNIDIRLRIDGVSLLDINVPCCGVRADVQAVFPDAPDRSGFGFLFNFANLSAGPHTIGIDVRPDDIDDRVVIDHNIFVLRPGNTDFINSFNLTSAMCSVDPTNNTVALNGVQLGFAGGEATTDLQLQYSTSTQGLVISEASGAPALTSFVAHLNGSQEVPRVDTPATGEATLTLNADNSLSCEVLTDEISDAVAAHIHLAPAGVNGEIIIPLAGGPPTWTCPSDPLTADQLAALQAGNLYVNVHSPEFPDGEIRGQIVAAGLGS